MAAAAVAIPGCAIDDAEACGEHQRLVKGADSETQACVCDEANGYVRDEDPGRGCKRCAAGTVAASGQCVRPSLLDGGGDSAVDGGAPDAAPPGGSQPTGVGEPCESSADCEGFDATFCDSFMTHTCFIERCAMGQNVCPTGTACCDYSALLTGISLCVQLDTLVDGECAMGGMRVEP